MHLFLSYNSDALVPLRQLSFFCSSQISGVSSFFSDNLDALVSLRQFGCTCFSQTILMHSFLSDVLVCLVPLIHFRLLIASNMKGHYLPEKIDLTCMCISHRRPLRWPLSSSIMRTTPFILTYKNGQAYFDHTKHCDSH